MSIYETVFGAVLRAQAFIYARTDGLIGHRMLGVLVALTRAH